jgi:hypothetical protein
MAQSYIAPIVPLGNTAGVLSDAALATYANFFQSPYPLQGLQTTMVHLAPNGNVTHLSGVGKGQEGVWAGQTLQGEQMLPFEQVITESAYQWGATIERTNYPKRLINFRIIISGQNLYQYQLCDNRWWQGQDETQDGWLGVYTRFSGWRWIPVRPQKTVDTTQKLDPAAFGNNIAVWDINWVCQRPWFSKPSLYGTWSAQGAPQDSAGNYYGTITLANQGDFQTYVQYIIDGAGVATVQDNNSSTMITLPPLFASDGPALCDTDPQERTLTASSDPVDNLFYQYIRSSSVLDFLLSNIGDAGEPWWQRGYTRFINSVPGQTVVQFLVKHTNPNATITVNLQQRYKRSR